MGPPAYAARDGEELLGEERSVCGRVSSKTRPNSAISLIPRCLVPDVALAPVQRIRTVLAGDAEGEAPIYGRVAPP